MNTITLVSASTARRIKRGFAVLSLAAFAIVTLFAFEAAPMRGATNEALAWSCSLQAEAVMTADGADVTLRWNAASDVAYITIDQFPGEQFPRSGSKQISITETTTFVAHTRVTWTTDTLTCKATIVVTPPVDTCESVDLTLHDKSFTWSGTATLEEYTVEFCDGTKDTQYVCYPNGATIEFDKHIKSVKACGEDCYREESQECPPPVVEDPVCDMSAHPITITAGQQTRIDWWSARADRVEFDGITSTLLEGSQTVSPATTTTYTGTFYGEEGTEEAFCSVTVVVIPVVHPEDPLCDISASPVTITQGEESTLTWWSTNADRVEFDGLTSNLLNGSQTVSPATTTTYTGTFYGEEGTEEAVCSTTITVVPPSLPEDPVCTIHANPGTITKGGQSAITWTSDDATSVVFENISSTLLDGTVNVSPATTTTYKGTFYGPTGTTPAVCTTTVTVVEEPEEPLPVCTMTVSPSQVNKGSTATLSWTSDNATIASINQGIGSVVLDGSQSVTVNAATTYTGTFTNAEGDAVTCSASVSIKTGGGGGRCLNCDDGDDDDNDNDKKDKKPSIVLSAKTTKGASITLDQVPYTGFEASPLVTVIFWVTILAISAAIAYMVTVIRHRMSFRSVTAGRTVQNVETNLVDYSLTAPSIHSSAARVEPITIARVAALGHGDAQQVIEEHAHRDNILLSPEATRMILGALDGAQGSRDAALQNIFERAKALYPREDGWILLSKERCTKLLSGVETPASEESAPAVVAPTFKVAPVQVAERHATRTTTDTVSSTFVQYLATNDQAKAFELLRNVTAQGTDISTFIGRVVRDLDEVYKHRIEGNRKPDQALVQLTSAWSTTTFETVLGALVECIDHSYSNTRIGAKVALAKAFEVFASTR